MVADRAPQTVSERYRSYGNTSMWYLRLIHRRRSPTVADHYRSYGHQALQPVTGETLNRQRSAFFDVRVCHPNADSFREMTPTANLQAARNRKEEAIFITGNGDRAWDIYATCIYHNRRNGMSQISLPIGRTYIHQERRTLRSNDIVDKN